jgi:hypothetical protein
MKFYFALALLVTAMSGTDAPAALGQTGVAGHIGFVLPLVTHSDGATTTIADGFSIGFPTGITIKGPGRLAFDMEFVPSIQKSPRSVSLTVHPGFVEALGRGFAVGVRAAFVVDSSTYGFTPLVNKSWPVTKPGLLKAYFIEADLPVRFDRPTGGPATTPVSFAMHFCVGF